MHDADEHMTETAAATTVIETDLPCRRCGYNLRSLRAAGDCPECALPVELSTRSDRLCDANPRWLGQLSVGLRIIAVCMALGEVVYWLDVYALPIPYQWFRYARFAGMPIYAYGLWQLTRPAPGAVGESAGMSARKSLRVLFGIVVVARVARSIAEYGVFGFTWPVVITMTLGYAVSIPFVIAMYTHLLVLARRIPNRVCTRAASTLRIVYTASLALVEVLYLIYAWSVMLPRPAITYSSGWPWLLDETATHLRTLTLICFVILLIRMDVLVRRARRTAMQSWTAATSQTLPTDSPARPA